MIKELRKKLDAKEISAVELAQEYFDRVEKTASDLNSFITITKEEGLAAAQRSQEKIENGTATGLTGIPYAAKDVFCTEGIPTTAASKILEKYIPPYSATVIDRLSDAVLLGKTNMDEFAMGSSSEYSAFGPVKNPINLDYVPGGSSGGSAAAVASGQAVFSLATDTCGSNRLPASFCGIVGYKPTYGSIPRFGVISMAASLDTVGIFTRSIADAAAVLDATTGPDGYDSTALSQKYSFADIENGSLQNISFGIPKEYIDLEGLSDPVKKVFEKSVAAIEKAGGKIVEISLPHTHYALPTYYVLCPAEVSSNMARYDGLQFGGISENAKTLDDAFALTREEGFGDEVKRRILTGTFILSAGHYDSYYTKAEKVRTRIIQDFDHAFETVDFLLSPTTPTPAFRLGDRVSDPLAMYASDVYAAPSSLAGVPAVSLPMGDVDGLPVGLQIIGAKSSDVRLLSTAHAIEQELSIDPLPLAL